jgi:hypothetical protein
MANYEPQILEEFADRLYKQAAEIISQAVVGGIVGGLLVGALFGAGAGVGLLVLEQAPGVSGDTPSMVLAGGAIGFCLLAVVGGVIGYFTGKEKSFELRLKAQQALCQLQIEKNTRTA